MKISAGMVLLYVFSYSCTTQNADQHTMSKEKQIQDELLKITALLRDTSFALEMAGNQEAAYYSSNGEVAPAFLQQSSDTATIQKSLSEEKIATSIAPFYALECGIQALMEQQGGTPVEWIGRVLDKKLDSGQMLLLNRFANATWKAGQPFRGLERVTRDVFVSSNFLSQQEVQKDFEQLHAAAIKLLPAMEGVKDSSVQTQLQRLSVLLKDKLFAQEMAQHIAAAYHIAQHHPVPDFFKAGEENVLKPVRLKDEKIATNIAGFYALECALSYFATAQHELPSAMLQVIVADSVNANDKILLERFANATWKAGQPFRGLNRIERTTFTCFDLLPQQEIDKDWVQIQSAAKKLVRHLE